MTYYATSLLYCIQGYLLLIKLKHEKSAHKITFNAKIVEGEHS